MSKASGVTENMVLWREGAGEGSAMEDSGTVEVAVPWKVLLLQEVLVLREVVILRKRRVLWVCWCQEGCWRYQ